MATPSTASSVGPPALRGKIVEAEVKVSVDAARPLPFVCALYAIETPEGMWLCAYYGANRSVFDFLPQKGTELDELKVGIAFHNKQFTPKDRYQPGLWEEFKKAYLITYGGHEE